MARDVWQKTITSLSGDALDGAQITVRNQQTNALSAIFDAQSGGSQRPNPFLTGADGVARFFAEPGFYKVTAFKDGFGTAEFIWNNLGDNNLRQDVGTAAFATLQANPTDATAGRVLTVGAFGLGSTSTEALSLTTATNRFGVNPQNSVARLAMVRAASRGVLFDISAAGSSSLQVWAEHYNPSTGETITGRRELWHSQNLPDPARLGQAQTFTANQTINADLNVTGSKNFRITNPVNENEYLYHSAIESDKPRTQYVHHVSVGESLEASVTLPDWFYALNGNTCTVFASPCKHFGQAYGEVVDGVLAITANAEGDYHVLIMAERSDDNISNFKTTALKSDVDAQDTPEEIEAEESVEDENPIP